MLFIKKSQNVIWIPKHNSYNGPFKLTLKNTMTNKETEFTELENQGINSGYYIFYGLDFTGLESGEHEYRVFNEQDNEIVEQGLLQVMYELSEPISVSYKKEQNKIIYKQ